MSNPKSLKFYKEYYQLSPNDAKKVLSQKNLYQASLLSCRLYHHIQEYLKENDILTYHHYSKDCAKILLPGWLTHALEVFLDRLIRTCHRTKTNSSYQLLSINLTGTAPQTLEQSKELIQSNNLFQEWLMSSIAQVISNHSQGNKKEIVELTHLKIKTSSIKHYCNKLKHWISEITHTKKYRILSNYLDGQSSWKIVSNLGLILAPIFSLSPNPISLTDRQQLGDRLMPVTQEALQAIWEELAKLTGLEIPDVAGLAKILAQYLAITIPSDLFENFTEGIEQAKVLIQKHRINALLTSVGETSSEFLYLLCVARKQGITSVGLQHGGGFGAAKSSSAITLIEQNTFDFFGTWGWKDWNRKFLLNNHSDNTLPLPSIKLYVDTKKIKNLVNGDKIIFITTFTHDYLVRFAVNVIPDLEESLIVKEKKILEHIAKTDEILYKTGHNVSFFKDSLTFRKKLFDGIPMNFLTSGVLSDYLPRAKLIMTDHFGTACYETIAANIPTMIWLDLEYMSFDEKFKRLLDKMASVGVVSYSPEDFCLNWNKIHGDVNTWWNSEDVQSALDSFRSQHCYIGPTPLKEFQRSLDHIIQPCSE